MTRARPNLILGIFYGGLALLLALVIPGILDALVPQIASRVAYNSEAHLFALMLGLWIQVGMARISPARRMQGAVVVGLVFALIGIGLLLSDLPSRIRTLNEPALALAILVPYVTLPRPLARWVLAVPPVLVLATVWAVIWAPESWIIDQAETFGFVVLAILTFDLIDRQLLEPNAPVRRGLRWAWYVFMVLEPVVVSGLGVAIRDDDDAIGLLLRYLGRIHESFVGILLVALILHLVRDYRAHLRRSS